MLQKKIGKINLERIFQLSHKCILSSVNRILKTFYKQSSHRLLYFLNFGQISSIIQVCTLPVGSDQDILSYKELWSSLISLKIYIKRNIKFKLSKMSHLFPKIWVPFVFSLSYQWNVWKINIREDSYIGEILGLLLYFHQKCN